jgi:hypothetical protein
VRLLLLKQLASAGVVASVAVEPAPNAPGQWVLNVIKTDGETITVSIAGDGRVKHYVRLTAALMDAHRLGVREVVTRLPEDFELNYGARSAARK